MTHPKNSKFSINFFSQLQLNTFNLSCHSTRYTFDDIGRIMKTKLFGIRHAPNKIDKYISDLFNRLYCYSYKVTVHTRWYYVRIPLFDIIFSCKMIENDITEEFAYLNEWHIFFVLITLKYSRI